MKNILPLLMFPGLIQASTVFTDSDFTDWQSPGQIQVISGSNSISGVLLPGGLCPPFFTLNVPENLEIFQLNILAYDTSLGNNGSFFGIQVGPTLSDAPLNFVNGTNTAPIDFLLFNDSLIGETNLLPQVIDDLPLNGATTLQKGSYALWLNETDPNAGVLYEIEFVARPIPEPSSGLLTLFALPLLLTRRKRS